METGSRLSVADVFVSIRGPRQTKKVGHDQVELLVIAVCGVLAGADDFVEIEEWAKEKRDWFQRYLRLEHGIPSHDTFGRVFAAIDAEAFSAVASRFSLDAPGGRSFLFACRERCFPPPRAYRSPGNFRTPERSH